MFYKKARHEEVITYSLAQGDVNEILVNLASPPRRRGAVRGLLTHDPDFVVEAKVTSGTDGLTCPPRHAASDFIRLELTLGQFTRYKDRSRHSSRTTLLTTDRPPLGAADR
ncbi:hypothetical protein EVAR_5652_1 [Eumeta japonica]|uniref:Uncharacterized protein n=1 Tax=Eumeta variegata TaxID=151549 RepID=A0A4C1T835_EUMVA|nr:hypothetical protein EVAR_5652_1 [Eumeta japonica]